MSQVAPASVHKLPALTYAEDALEPVISRRTVEFRGKSAMSAAARRAPERSLQDRIR